MTSHRLSGGGFEIELSTTGGFKHCDVVMPLVASQQQALLRIQKICSLLDRPARLSATSTSKGSKTGITLSRMTQLPSQSLMCVSTSKPDGHEFLSWKRQRGEQSLTAQSSN